jgi:crotonobetainyl-CoA:carnitine CoA-transferase CaiB-like acyl-CoA transferase
VTDPTPGPLTGLLVADFSRVLAGPYCTMLLGDLGATVVKVEGPAGDETRHWHPPTRQTANGEESTYFLSVNRSKRAVTLDLADAEDRAVAHRLAARADVVIENFKRGGLARYGLDFDTVRAQNPAVIYASISGFGPESDLPGYDALAQALSGLMSVTGPPDGEPSKAGVAIVDVVTGLHAAVGILAALHHRSETGEGQRVEVNLLSSALSALVNQSGAYALAGLVPRRLGNDHPSIYPYGPFPTADGQLVIAIGNDAQFARLCAAIGAPALAEDPRFRRAPDRSRQREALRPALESALRARPASEWYDLLAGADVPCAPVLDIGEAFAWADRLGVDPVVEAGDERMPGVRHPITFSATPAAYPLAPPAPDADRAWLDALLAE